jgi:hypothetical protein
VHSPLIYDPILWYLQTFHRRCLQNLAQFPRHRFLFRIGKKEQLILIFLLLGSVIMIQNRRVSPHFAVCLVQLNCYLEEGNWAHFSLSIQVEKNAVFKSNKMQYSSREKCCIQEKK